MNVIAESCAFGVAYVSVVFAIGLGFGYIRKGLDSDGEGLV